MRTETSQKGMKPTMEQARYQEIAHDIAHAIVYGEYQENEKISGRSTLAGRFKASPETIRRSLAILQSMGIVSIRQGMGVTVESKAMAERFLRLIDQKNEVENTFAQLRLLTAKRREIDQEIEHIIQKIFGYTDKYVSRWNHLSEIDIRQESHAVGRSLRELAVRERTGANIIGVVRNHEDILTLDADFVFQAGDILLLFSSDSELKSLEAFLNRQIRED